MHEERYAEVSFTQIHGQSFSKKMGKLSTFAAFKVSVKTTLES